MEAGSTAAVDCGFPARYSERVSKVRIECKYQDRIVVADPTTDPWEIREQDDPEQQEIPWRVLLVAPQLERLPVVLVDRQDAEFLEKASPMPPDLGSALDDAWSG